jgi:hypothetical protein
MLLFFLRFRPLHDLMAGDQNGEEMRLILLPPRIVGLKIQIRLAIGSE